MSELTYILQSGVGELPAAALFIFFFFATFVSEDAACVLAGSAVASGRIGFAVAVTACFAGIFAGDILLFGAGRMFGARALNIRFIKRFIPERSVSKARTWLESNTAAAVFLSRFVTGLRLPTYVAAGAFGTGFVRFAAYFVLASALWTPILVGSAAFSQAFIFSQNALLGLVVTALSIRFVVKYSSWRNRRLLIGRFKRVVKWEFWPVQVFYIPVVIYVLALAARYRSLTAFTAANPSLPAGGFKGESKNDIYDLLRQSPATGTSLLRHAIIDRAQEAENRLESAWRFIDDNSLSFPLAVKPDAGERGKGASIVYSIRELEATILASDTDLIIQEFADGIEASVFYYRHPRHTVGRIFSVTEKKFPTLIGNGRATVEELILNDARAVCLAERYFERNRNRLDQVPASGEEVRLVDIGTHSRGAIFLDGSHLMTDILAQKIDDICRGIDGFYFGRFDIRSKSAASLQAGEFKIIELNGVTSESTNIYDPKYGLLDAYRILFAQWRLAFEIGSENIVAGAGRTGISDLIRMTFGADRKIDRERPHFDDRS